MGGGLAKGAAPTSEAEADKAFKEIDSNGDGMLSRDEIKAAIAKHGKLCKAKWSDAKIVETICKFDVDGNGQLCRDEFLAMLTDLKDPRSKCIPAAPRNAPASWTYFLSHVQREAGTEAVQLAGEFGKKACWLDRNMKDKSEEAMKEGVCCSDFFLCVLSDGYFKSSYCIKEMQWAFAERKKIISTYKAGVNVGAILREAPETFRAAISSIDSIKLDGSDPDYFEVGIRKIAAAAFGLSSGIPRSASAARSSFKLLTRSACESGGASENPMDCNAVCSRSLAAETVSSQRPTIKTGSIPFGAQARKRRPEGPGTVWNGRFPPYAVEANRLP